MKVAVFNSKNYTQNSLIEANKDNLHQLVFFEEHLDEHTTQLTKGFEAVCVFVNDTLDRKVLGVLSQNGVRLVALRSAGFNNVDLLAAGELGIKVVRVPAYSPHAVAEHTIGLIMALNRKICRAHSRIREANFSIEGLLGFELYGCTAGIIGTGKIGTIVARILNGFGCRLLACDPYPNPACMELGIEYTALERLFAEAHIITLHCPLTPQTYHIIDAKAIEQMQKGVMLINTSRGAMIDTKAVIDGLKKGKIGHFGIDVYEEEADLFFEDLSDMVIQDDVFARLLTFPNVIITGHQAFFTQNALEDIARTTLSNITDFEQDRPCVNEVTAELITKRE